MALPSAVAAKVKTIPMSPTAIANDFQLAYMLSFNTNNVTHSSIHCSPKDTYQSPLANYSFVDFDQPTYETLLAETTQNYLHKKQSMVRGIRQGFKEFYMRVASTTYIAALKSINQPKEHVLFNHTDSDLDYKIESMRGNIASKWPQNLAEFHKEINALPWNAFCCDSQIIHNEFLASVRKAIETLVAKLKNKQLRNREVLLQQLRLECQIFLGITLRINSQKMVLQSVQFFKILADCLTPAEEQVLCLRLDHYMSQFFRVIPQKQTTQYHARSDIYDKGAFMIMKKIHFQRQAGLCYFSTTTDGKFLYIFVSSVNGGMFKIGTGYGNTVAGKVYYEKNMFLPVGSKPDQISWVYLKGKIYLKSSSKEPNQIQIINPQNFKSEGNLVLNIPSLFKHQSLINLNRNSIILVDGLNLYFLGKRIKIVKGDGTVKKDPIIPKQQQNKQEDDGKKKKKGRPKNKKSNDQPQPNQVDDSANNVVKVIQFVLFEFDLQKGRQQTNCEGGDDDQPSSAIVSELLDSFSGYFTKQECQTALKIGNNDLQSACQWLVQQAEKHRHTNIISPSCETIISEAQIANDFNQKQLKGSNQIITKEGSTIHMQNISESIWTMDNEHITCYSQSGIKIFSKDRKQSVKSQSRCKLISTLVETKDTRFPRNPEYTITYDPYNQIFYTFTWPPQGGHSFPTAVLIGSDPKSAGKIQVEKRTSVSIIRPKRIEQLGISSLLKLVLFDGKKHPENYRINDWLWHYGQKIKDINILINSQDADKKKLGNKRIRYLAKINKINQVTKASIKDLEILQKKQPVIKQVFKVYPFAADGSLQNLRAIQRVFKDITTNFSQYIISIQNWIENSPNLLTNEISRQVQSIGMRLLDLKGGASKSQASKITQLLISEFFLFFPSSRVQAKFIESLNSEQLNNFTQKQYLSQIRTKSLIYEIKNKDNVITKFESKSPFAEVFPNLSTSKINGLRHKDQADSIGNLFLDTIILTPKQKQYKLRQICCGKQIEQATIDNSETRKSIFQFLQKKVLSNSVDIKLIQFLFLQSIRLITEGRTFKEYLADMNEMFKNVFKLLQGVLQKSSVSLTFQILQCLSMVLQIYFCSLSQLTPQKETIQSLIKIIEYLHRTDSKGCIRFLNGMQFQGISQISEKIYQTSHPISRGKSQAYPTRSFPDASLIFVEFDKRCQSDQNHDIMSIQTIHADSPVGNTIHCNDGVFSTNLRMSGKIDSSKPYLIFGNSVSIQFTSSGHAKDAQSFGQYGFKFGLRPIHTGKIKVSQEDQKKIKATFGTLSQFTKYANTLKLSVIVASTAIENLMNIPESTNQSKVSNTLKGKIFKQGLEDEFLKEVQNKNSLSPTSIIEKCLGFSNSQNLQILRSIHSIPRQTNVDDQKPIIQANQQIWNFEGIPNYIRNYLEQIRAFKGDFVDVFKQARAHVKQTGKYAAQLKRRSFEDKYKQRWLQGQSILFLTVLKHSGLLHLDLKFSIQYIKQNLKAFEQARNGIFYSFISRMQTVRQWRDLLDTYYAKQDQQPMLEKQQQKEPQKEERNAIKVSKRGVAGRAKAIKIRDNRPGKMVSVAIKPKVQSKIEKQNEKDQTELVKKQKSIRERLSDNFMIQQVCELKGIKYVPNETYDNVTRIIEAIKAQKMYENSKSVYEQPIDHLIRSCLFLLRLKSPSTQQSLNASEDQIIVPNAVTRAFSQDNRNVNTSKVNLFRQWLQNWKKWKGFKKQGNKIELKFPVCEIVDFVNSWLPNQTFAEVISLRSQRANKRKQFYQYLADLSKVCSNSFLRKYVLGLETIHLPNSFQDKLQSVPPSRISAIAGCYKQYSTVLLEMQKEAMRALPKTLKEVNAVSKNSREGILSIVQENADHLYLTEVDNRKVNLEVAMYLIPFRYLSNAYEELVLISSLITQAAFISNHDLSDILSCLQKEIGSDSLSSKRWSDYFFIERVMFLLRKIQEKTRHRLQFKEKRRVAEVLFCLIYLTEVPIICRVSLRILKSLKINLKQGLKTPFDNQFCQVRLNEGQPIVVAKKFRLENKNGLNNIELLYKRLDQSLSDKKDDLRSRLQLQDDVVMQQSQKKYSLVLNLHNQEQLIWMVKALYYLQQIEGKIKLINDWEQYQALKTKKKEQLKEKQAQKKQLAKNENQKIAAWASKQPNNPEITTKPQKKQTQVQRILTNIPQTITEIDPQLQATLPIGWFFNYCDVFAQFIDRKKIDRKQAASPLPALLNSKSKKNTNLLAGTRKVWVLPLFQKLLKKFEDLYSKGPEQPKDQDTAQLKQQFIKSKNYIARIRKHTVEVSHIVSELNQFGYYNFRQQMSYEKASLIAQIFTLASEGRLKPIPCQFSSPDLINKYTPHMGDQPTSSKLKICIIESSKYQRLEQILNSLTNEVILDHNKHSYYASLNKQELSFEDIKYLPFEQLPQIDTQDDQIKVGKQFVDSGLCRMRRQHQQVQLKDYPSIRYFISQGGIQSGLKSALLIPSSETNITVQSALFEKVFPLNTKAQSASTPEQLIQSILKIIKGKLPKISEKKSIAPYILLSSYLQKLGAMDLSFVDKNQLKQLGTQLYDFSRKLKSTRPIQNYRQEIQKLLIKLDQKKHKHLNIFQIYNPSQQTNQQLSKFANVNSANSSHQIKIETSISTISTHQSPKSSYLLKSHPPQIQQNKLLKYWEKNIIPKIYDFVKTTLRPIQIQDFFEQIRIPLRVNDQIEAKKVAYVICDNKLPNGAVLPDANHNWNSLSIEDIYVGQNALLKLSRNKAQASSPLLSCSNQDYRLVQVAFIQARNGSILVRYRLKEHSILSYMWVPVNSLLPVEVEIADFKTDDIYKQLQEDFEGIIYGYSKLCLTQLVSVAELRPDQLIKETIADMFRDSPISGWLGSYKYNWSMRSTLKNMLKQNNLNFIKDLQEKFYPVKSYNINLLSEKMLRLNRFENSSGLIISFKKDTSISLCSGLHFFNDQYGYSEIQHVYTAKSQRSDIPPIEFNQPDVYCRYYTNKDCLRSHEQNKYNPKPIQVTVFSIQPIWTIGCYLGDVISQIAVQECQHIQILARLNKLYINWILNKNLAVLCGYLAKLVAKISNRIGQICTIQKKPVTLQVMGVDLQTVKKILEWVNQMAQEEEKQLLVLYSTLLQNMSEMIAAILWKAELPNGANLQIPEHINAMMDLIKLVDIIELNLKGKAIKIEVQQPSLQWQRILAVDNIPQYIKPQVFRSKVKQILSNKKAKILSPKYDIFIQGNKGIVLVDGWDVTELVQEQIMEKIQQQQSQVQPEQEQGLAMQWMCEMCTFFNSVAVNLCDMCQSPMPPPKALDPSQIYQKVESADVNQAQKKLKEKEAKRFLSVRDDILRMFQDEWKAQCCRVEQSNKELQEKIKRPEYNINRKKKESQLQKKEQVPNKQEIRIITGSDVLAMEIIESFLTFRFKALPQSIKDLVTKKQSSYLEKFKELLKVGYDLWGDHVKNEAPMLLPFNKLSYLMGYIQNQICKGSSSVLSYNENSIRLISQIPIINDEDEQPINFSSENNIGIRVKYKALAESPSHNIRYSWKIIKQFNLAVSKCLQFINMDLSYAESSLHQDSKGSSLASKIKFLRKLIMGTLKLQLSQKIIQKTSVIRENEYVPKITLQRLKIKQDRQKNRTKPISVKDKDDYLFTKSHQQFQNISPAMLRPFKPKGTDPYLSFIVNFKGQMAMGQAGPYRQFFTDISNELSPEQGLGLFIPTPNNKHKMGQAKSKWIVNPTANSTYHLSLLEFVGILMGCCIRTGTHLALQLPKIFWKSLVGETIKDQDLQEIDVQFIRTNEMIQNCPGPQAFEQIQLITGQAIFWTGTTSDGCQHELIFDGKTKKVEYEDRLKYIKASRELRITESELQMKRIKKGLEQMMPGSYLNCLTGDQLKRLVCGVPRVDVDLLKKHTKYAGGMNEETPRIKFFWEVMRQMTESDRLKLIRFCWGQERLPMNSQQFERNGIRFMIKPMINKNNPNYALPKADTCFFNIELPDYSTKDIMKEKILLAINVDNVSINADENQNPDDNPLMNEIQDYDDDNVEENQWE